MKYRLHAFQVVFYSNVDCCLNTYKGHRCQATNLLDFIMVSKILSSHCLPGDKLQLTVWNQWIKNIRLRTKQEVILASIKELH